MAQLTIAHTTKQLPKLPLTEVKEAILGVRYSLSVTFLGERRAQQLNVASRNKTYTPNVLSFPLTNTAGEIYLCPMVAKREANTFGRTPNQQLLFLIINGCLHLKGYDHGATMERLERKFCTRFGCASQHDTH
jgi:rRNA maturation RNase YbeY